MKLRRRHPSERALLKWGELSPELRTLIARAARSVAKDSMQELMEAHGFPFVVNADGSPLTAEQRRLYSLSPLRTTDNDAWSHAATDLFGVSPEVVTRYLHNDRLTFSEISSIDHVVKALGTPPQLPEGQVT